MQARVTASAAELGLTVINVCPIMINEVVRHVFGTELAVFGDLTLFVKDLVFGTELYDGATANGTATAASSISVFAPAPRLHGRHVSTQRDSATCEGMHVILVLLDQHVADAAQRRLRRAEEFPHRCCVHDCHCFLHRRARSGAKRCLSPDVHDVGNASLGLTGACKHPRHLKHLKHLSQPSSADGASIRGRKAPGRPKR